MNLFSLLLLLLPFLLHHLVSSSSSSSSSSSASASASPSASSSPAISGRIQSLHDSSKCLSIADTTVSRSPVVLGDCARSTVQRWTDNSNNWQIVAARGDKCLQIRHAAENDSDDFTNDPIEAAGCRYAGGRGANRSPEGFQRLVFVNHTIVWRGQLRVLPANVTARYCVEAEGRGLGSAVNLQHCEAGDKAQHWIFVTDRGEKREQAWDESRFDDDAGRILAR